MIPTNPDVKRLTPTTTPTTLTPMKMTLTDLDVHKVTLTLKKTTPTSDLQL